MALGKKQVKRAPKEMAFNMLSHFMGRGNREKGAAPVQLPHGPKVLRLVEQMEARSASDRRVREERSEMGEERKQAVEAMHIIAGVDITAGAKGGDLNIHGKAAELVELMEEKLNAMEEKLKAEPKEQEKEEGAEAGAKKVLIAGDWACRGLSGVSDNEMITEIVTPGTEASRKKAAGITKLLAEKENRT